MTNEENWLVSDESHDNDRSDAQISGILAWLERSLTVAVGKVLDLGCGSGRVLTHLVRAGHDVVGIDDRADALACCRDALGEDANRCRLIKADFLGDDLCVDGKFDLILCVGNTFAAITDVDQAVAFFCRIKERLEPGGALAIDDLPFEFWAEVAEGNWQNGISEDGQWQMIWTEGDPVVALRHGEGVDPVSTEIRPDDTLLRLWTMGELRLAARLAGLSGPEHRPDDALLMFRNNSVLRD